MKNILLLGSNGQIGRELGHLLPAIGHVCTPTKHMCDLSCADSIIQTVRDSNPDLIINAAAYTNVEKAESEQALAQAINGIAPGILAEESKKRQIPFIHYSTDYVFDGTKNEPYLEDNKANPLNAYGYSKLMGEKAIEAVDSCYFILRTSWIYGWQRQNFLLTMLRLASEKEELRIVDDQIGTPNWAATVAKITTSLLLKITPERSGIYHLSCEGQCSWYHFAQTIFDHLPLKKKPVLIPIRSKDYPTLAQRPLFSVLDNTKIKQAFDLIIPNWQTEFYASCA